MFDSLIDHRRCYVVGSVSQEPDGNRAAFAAACEQLKSEGWLPWNPTAEPDSAAVEAESKQLIAQGDMYSSGPLYRAFMRRMFRYVIDSAQIFVLPGWHKSQNACFEVVMAQKAGIPVVDYESRKPLPIVRLDVWDTHLLGEIFRVR